MNSLSASSVSFLNSLSNYWYLIVPIMGVLAIGMAGIRYIASAENESQKWVTAQKKISSIVAAVVAISIVVGGGVGVTVFNYINNGVNTNISNNASNSMEVGGTQYTLKIQHKDLQAEREAATEKYWEHATSNYADRQAEANVEAGEVPDGMTEEQYKELYSKYYWKWTTIGDTSEIAKNYRKSEDKNAFINNYIKEQAGIYGSGTSADAPQSSSEWNDYIKKTTKNSTYLGNNIVFH